MSQATAPISHTDRFYIGGQWVAPSSDATISVIDSDTEQVYFTVPEAQAADISRAVGAAREAFDSGPWPWLSHEQRADYLRVAARLRSGTVGHNAMRTDFGVSFGGFKQSGIGREGVHEGLPPFLEVKFIVLEGRPEGYEDVEP